MILQNDAASTIQQAVKTRLSKKDNAATKIQGAIRNKNAKKELESLREDEEKRKQYYNDVWNKQRNDSATKIQQALKVKKKPKFSIGKKGRQTKK